MIKEKDFIFLLSLMIIEESDNTDYFLYKFNLSNKNKKRIKYIDNFYKKKISKKTFTKNNMNKVFYYDGKQAVDDILCFYMIKSKKLDQELIELNNFYKNKLVPQLPIGAEILKTKYRIPEGKQLGSKLRMIEEKWVENNFQISDQQIDNIINN